MKKYLFVDRDGTLLFEPPETQQIDSLEEMVILPHVISSLKRFAKGGYEIIVVTNQDHLGTPKNPRENYEQINRKLLQILKSEDVVIAAFLECPHAANADCACRKPKTGLIDNILKRGRFDRDRSIVVGDRETDIAFAENAGLKGYLLGKMTWPQIAKKVLDCPRLVEIRRDTAETQISMILNLDGSGRHYNNTGLEFFNHMLDQLTKHSEIDLTIKCYGDLKVDAHHTIEDVGLVLGQAFDEALGDRRGISRFASEKILPMDEAKAEVALDISGRPYLKFSAEPMREFAGDFPTDMLEHFLRSFSQKAGITLHVTVTGQNTHHMVEVVFKALGRCLRDAIRIEHDRVASTKGLL